MTHTAVDVRHPHVSGAAQPRGLGNTRRRIGRIALALGAMTAVLAATAGPAQAGTADRDGRLQNWATNNGCLDSNSSGAVYSNPCQLGNPFQIWQIRGPIDRSFDGYDQVTLRNKGTDRCLEVYVDDGTYHVGTDVCRGDRAAFQSIDAVGPDWGNVHFRNSEGSPLVCLDSHNNRDAYTNNCNFGTFQTWRLV